MSNYRDDSQDSAIASDFSGNLGPAIDSVISAFTTIVNTVSWVAENFQTLVTTDHPTGGFIPYNRLDMTELLNGAFQLFIFRITPLEIFSWVVFGG